MKVVRKWNLSWKFTVLVSWSLYKLQCFLLLLFEEQEICIRCNSNLTNFVSGILWVLVKRTNPSWESFFVEKRNRSKGSPTGCPSSSTAKFIDIFFLLLSPSVPLFDIIAVVPSWSVPPCSAIVEGAVDSDIIKVTEVVKQLCRF